MRNNNTNEGERSSSSSKQQPQAAPKSLMLIDSCLRLSVVPLSVATIWLTVTNHQSNPDYGDLDYNSIMGLKYIVGVSAICAIYALLSTLSTWVTCLVSKAWFFFVPDQVLAYLMITSVAGATELVSLLYEGDKTVTWSGKKFCTTIDTLTNREPDSMLAAMFSGRHAMCQESQTGCVFIDRDGKHFRHILNWLRDGIAPSLSDHDCSELLREADYYQLLGLKERIKDSWRESGEVEAELTRVDIIKCIQSERVRFRGVNLSGIDLSKLDLSLVDFSYACLRNVFFSRTNLQCAKFRDADAEGSIFHNATLRECEFTGANLRGALLAGTNLQSANLQDACLVDCSFCGADLRSAHLQNADLTNANLEGANLEGANLKGAKLTNANLKGANLQRAYLRHVNLREAHLEGANLGGANMTGAIR
ncbi:unnamed protein product [Thlaspi arvense]|uniref:CASP-like protein n=1 Tax=Thlaspi arvense TaxID=13288 RepID=A0AAU9SMV4_THLAR|nr:unnamed protein product [Thlaspi arvense]